MLILQRSEGSGQRWPLDQETITIGRGPDVDIVLPERVVSRRHARIERREDGYYVFDELSKNGTFVNGEPVTEGTRLQDGDELQIALRFRLAFVDAGATAPLTLDFQPSSAQAGLALDIPAGLSRSMAYSWTLPYRAPNTACWRRWSKPTAPWSHEMA